MDHKFTACNVGYIQVTGNVYSPISRWVEIAESPYIATIPSEILQEHRS